jgi:hypothetical protein
MRSPGAGLSTSSFLGNDKKPRATDGQGRMQQMPMMAQRVSIRVCYTLRAAL